MDWNQLLDIQLRSKGNNDVARLIAYVKELRARVREQEGDIAELKEQIADLLNTPISE